MKQFLIRPGLALGVNDLCTNQVFRPMNTPSSSPEGDRVECVLIERSLLVCIVWYGVVLRMYWMIELDQGFVMTHSVSHHIPAT